MGGHSQPYESRDEAMEVFAAHVSRGKVDAFQALGIDLVLGRREGPFFWDAYDGRRFYNCHCNGGVFNLGHRNPAIVARLRDALERDELDVGNHHLVSGWKAELGRRLAATTDGRLPGVVFSRATSGAASPRERDLAGGLAEAGEGEGEVAVLRDHVLRPEAGRCNPSPTRTPSSSSPRPPRSPARRARSRSRCSASRGSRSRRSARSCRRVPAPRSSTGRRSDSKRTPGRARCRGARARSRS